jgi:hypothetical protein|nr:MAG TPA: Putative tail protein [Caudoviricetes sp.]
MSITCQCPAAEAIPNVPNVACSESFGQIQKVAITRLRQTDGKRNSFTTAAGIKKLESWEPKLSANDGTKIVVTPYINSPADSGGDVRQSSGGNDDLGGIPDVLGENPVQFAGVLRAIPQAVAKALKSLICESNAKNLGVFLFDEKGNIEAIQDETTATTYYPIPIHSFFVGSKLHGNYDAKDNNPISWTYEENYSDNLVIITPEFNPLTELENAEK